MKVLDPIPQQQQKKKEKSQKFGKDVLRRNGYFSANESPSFVSFKS